MSDQLSQVLSEVVDFSDYTELLPLLRNTIIACVALGVVGGLIGVFVMMRDMAFAVHGISELSFAGASVGLLLGAGVVPGSLIGSMLAALVIGVLGSRARDRNSATAVLMPFGLGLGILSLSLYSGRASNKFGLLTGQIVAIDNPQITSLLVICALVAAGLLVIWRPLLFASTDPVTAQARGVPTRALSVVFMVLLGAAVAVSVQIVGALLVLSLLVTPAAAAMRLSASPVRVTLLSVAFALAASVGGVLLAAGSSVPISPFITTISFVIYGVCRLVSGARGRV
ncbi:metal ABC transporter permease [Brachybacterium sp. MASK1Z-5]|uniref:Metal ABC transporter permease n=1 Tax=Brachybacterium halotolerans TaxID=2795215 RepID=A0ABS1BAI0_9MICO|nr:metal ABC transporter permease [Brachybacterium halotolerans]MBK0330970.1 metal ABC transporter permease [Brachybacterium halotolerans]